MPLLCGLVLVAVRAFVRENALPWKIHLGSGDTLVRALDPSHPIVGPSTTDLDFYDGDRATLGTGRGGVLYDRTADTSLGYDHMIVAYAGTPIVVGRRASTPGAPDDGIELTSPNNGQDYASIRVTTPAGAMRTHRRKIIIRIKSSTTAALGTDLIVTTTGSNAAPAEITNQSGVESTVTFTMNGKTEPVSRSPRPNPYPATSPIENESLRVLTMLFLQERPLSLPFRITVAPTDKLYDDGNRPIPNPPPSSRFDDRFGVVCSPTSPNQPRTVVRAGKYLIQNVSRLDMGVTVKSSPLPNGAVPGFHIAQGGVLVQRGLALSPRLLVITTEDATVFAGGSSPLAFRVIRDPTTQRTTLRVYRGHVEVVFGNGAGSSGLADRANRVRQGRAPSAARRRPARPRAVPQAGAVPGRLVAISPAVRR